MVSLFFGFLGLTVRASDHRLVMSSSRLRYKSMKQRTIYCRVKNYIYLKRTEEVVWLITHLLESGSLTAPHRLYVADFKQHNGPQSSLAQRQQSPAQFLIVNIALITLPFPWPQIFPCCKGGGEPTAVVVILKPATAVIFSQAYVHSVLYRRMAVLTAGTSAVFDDKSSVRDAAFSSLPERT